MGMRRAGSSSKRVRHGLRFLRSLSIRKSRPVRESTAVTSAGSWCTPNTLATVPITRQVRELQAALSVNKSELARILRVSRPTVYDWLDDGQPNADNLSRIRTLLRLLSGSRVSASNPLFPRFVRSPHEPGAQPLLDLLCAETIDEAAATDAIRRATALGDAMDSRREEREARLQSAGFEEPTGGLETE